MSIDPKLGPAIPNVFVTDMAAALTYYSGPLGFEVLFTWGEPTFYAQLRRDAAILALRCVGRAALDHSLAVDLLSAFIEVHGAGAAGVDALCQSMQSSGAFVYQAPRDEPWGMRSFIVRDADGNLVCFAGLLKEPA